MLPTTSFMSSRRGCMHLPPAEGQQLPGQAGGPLGRLGDLLGGPGGAPRQAAARQ